MSIVLKFSALAASKSSSRHVDVLALRVLERLHDLVVRDGLPLLLADLLVADAASVLLVHVVEVEVLLVDRAVHPHGHVHEPEGDRAGPDRAGHGSGFPAPGLAETRPSLCRSQRLGPTRRSLGFAPVDEKTRDPSDDRDRLPRRDRHRRGRLLHPVASRPGLGGGEGDRRGLLVRRDHLRVIFALVAGVSDLRGAGSSARRADDEDDGSPIHGHTGIEIVWTAIPTVLVDGDVRLQRSRARARRGPAGRPPARSR